jgi:hypothetical protein
VAGQEIGVQVRQEDDVCRLRPGGYACYPALVDDPWLAPLRSRQAFKKVLADTRKRHDNARSAFEAANGPQLLGAAR